MEIKKHPHELKDLPELVNIKTGLGELDYLLCPEEDTRHTGGQQDSEGKLGIYIPGDNDNKSTPIIVVEGGSGSGKSALLTQTACNLAAGYNKDLNNFLCLFYSLEQDPYRIFNVINGFNFFDIPRRFKKANPKEYRKNLKEFTTNYFINLEESTWHDIKDVIEIKSEYGYVIFPILPPLWDLEDTETQSNNFNRRFNDLSNATLWFKRLANDLNIHIFCFLDSLNAFSSSPLNREQASRLFSFFRQNKVPLMASLERQGKWGYKSEITHYNISRYLADIEIALDDDYESGYYRQNIEVKKTRFNRRVLGKHQMKVKSPNKARTREYDPRVGIVIYPSIHAILSRNNSLGRDERDKEKRGFNKIFYNKSPNKHASRRKNNNSNKYDKKKLVISGIISSKHIDIYTTEDTFFNDNSCFVVSGPLGCHKFALAVNLLLNHKPYPATRNKEKSKYFPRKLIISLAEESAIELDKVALINKLDAWRDKLKYIKRLDKSSQVISETIYGANKNNKYLGIVSVLNFAMGQIMPEEFMYIISKYLKNNPSIDSILFENTAHIRNRFPALSREPLFTPSLVDLFKKSGCYSVFVDVGNSTNYDNHSRALLAAADCRLLVNYPGNGSGGIELTVHNVAGKKYSDTPKEVSVTTIDDYPILSIKRPQQKRINNLFIRRNLRYR